MLFMKRLEEAEKLLMQVHHLFNQNCRSLNNKVVIELADIEGDGFKKQLQLKRDIAKFLGDDGND